MASKTITLVSGANKGIGYETVKALLESDRLYHIFLGSRSVERGQEAVRNLQKECPGSPSTVEDIQLDVESDQSIESAFNTVKNSVGRLDTLINNAGMSKDIDHLRGKATLRQSLADTYNVNVAGTHVVTSTFLPLLFKSHDPRLIFVSGLGTFDRAVAGDIPLPNPLEPGWPKKTEFETIGYRCSKTALNMLMLDYHWRLQKDGVKVWSVAPGWLVTDLGGAREIAAAGGAGPASAGGAVLRSVVEGERDADVGKYVKRDGIVPF